VFPTLVSAGLLLFTGLATLFYEMFAIMLRFLNVGPLNDRIKKVIAVVGGSKPIES
jgi:hypothetical protein